MHGLSEHDVFIFITQLGVIIFFARLCGEISRRLGQPFIVGEVGAGIFLGPIVFGKLFPAGYATLFPTTGPHEHLLQGISWLCILFLLLLTGLEIDVQKSFKQAEQSLRTSILGIIFPFIGIFWVTAILPGSFYPTGVNDLDVRLLLTIALSVVAIPVIAKILFDLKILRSNVGLNIMTVGILSDFWGWSILAVVISLITSGSVSVGGVLKPLLTMAAYLGFTVTAGRWIVEKVFAVFQKIGFKADDPSAVLALLFSLTFLNCALAHVLGVHVIFGAFIAGIMAGESNKLSSHMRQIIEDFILGVFAPIFFVLIGMQLTFTEEMHWGYIFLLLAVGTITRIAGAYLGGIWGGIGQRNALAVACGLNTQGTMGIIVALIGVNLGIFNETLFSAVVVICVLTSLLVGPLLKWAIAGVKRPLAKYFPAKHIFLDVEGNNKFEVIQNMVQLMTSHEIITNPDEMQHAIWQREESMSTAVGEGVAVPHARIDNLTSPLICFFRLKNAIDYNSPDDVPVQLLFLELTDSNDDGIQLNLMAQVARFLTSPANRKRLLDGKTEEEIHHILSFDERA